MKRKFLLIPAAIFAVSFFAGVAFAHNSSASMTCQGGLVLDAVQFRADLPNHAYWKIDSLPTGQAQFGGSFHKTVANPDKTVLHTWQVQFTAGDGAQFDRSFSGTVQACEQPPTTTVAPTTTVPATTTPRPTTTTVVDTTTSEPATTTSVVAVDEPPVPTTVSPTGSVTGLGDGSSLEPALPRTGSNDGVLILVAVTFVLCGTYLVVRGRRVP